MLRISLEQWRMFIMVAEHGGFNQAAQAIFKSQSSIHNAVQKIEHSLGVKLFRIEGRKTLLTDAGEITRHMRDMLSGVDGLILECNHDAGMLASSSYPLALQRRIAGRRWRERIRAAFQQFKCKLFQPA